MEKKEKQNGFCAVEISGTEEEKVMSHRLKGLALLANYGQSDVQALLLLPRSTVLPQVGSVMTSITKGQRMSRIYATTCGHFGVQVSYCSRVKLI